jgi:hypothetical protein
VLNTALLERSVPPVAALYHANDEPAPDAVKVVGCPAKTVAEGGVTEGAGVGVLVSVVEVRELEEQPSDEICSA